MPSKLTPEEHCRENIQAMLEEGERIVWFSAIDAECYFHRRRIEDRKMACFVFGLLALLALIDWLQGGRMLKLIAFTFVICVCVLGFVKLIRSDTMPPWFFYAFSNKRVFRDDGDDRGIQTVLIDEIRSVTIAVIINIAGNITIRQKHLLSSLVVMRYIPDVQNVSWMLNELRAATSPVVADA